MTAEDDMKQARQVAEADRLELEELLKESREMGWDQGVAGTEGADTADAGSESVPSQEDAPK